MSYKIQIQFKKEFIEILEVIEEVLLLEEHLGQARVINELKHILIADKINQFIERANAADVWGGPGAVWEAYFKDQERHKKFVMAMKAFIDVMDRAGIMGNGAKSLKMFFTNYNDL